MKLLLLWLEIFWAFAKVSLITWGGGPASLAVMRNEAVQRGFISEEEFTDTIALGNSLPGPIAPQMAIYIGFHHVSPQYGVAAGVVAGLMGMLGCVVPTSLLMLTIAAFFFSFKDRPEVQAMLKAVRPVVVGMLLWTAYDLGRAVLIPRGAEPWPALAAGWDKVLIVIVSFVVLTTVRGDQTPVLLVLGAALFGILVYR